MIPSCLSDSIADAERLDFGPRLPNKREGEYDSLELTNDAVMVSGGETLFMADDELNRACGVGEA